MLKFYQLRPKPKSREEIKQIPQPLLKKFFKNFCEKSGKSFEITKSLEVKLIHYLFVLALIINNFEFDIANLIKDVGLTQKEVTFHLKQVGCQIKVKSKQEDFDTSKKTKERHKVAQLVAPLKFPDLERRTFRKKKTSNF